MLVITRLQRYGVSALLVATAAFSGPAGAQNPSYSIVSLNTPSPNFITSGDQVTVRVNAPTDAMIAAAGIRLNGADVSAAFVSNGTPGSMTGTIAGLQTGDNTIELFKLKTQTTSPLARLTVVRPLSAVMACSALSAAATGLMPVANTVITSSTLVNAAGSVPQHCNVVGTINAGRVGAPTPTPTPVSRYTYAINWQARLPIAWNGRFYMPGGGGTDGSVPATTGNLADGYAAAANDSGHNNGTNTDPLAGGTASFGTDFQARVDFAYNAIDVTTQTAKALVGIFYGTTPKYSYFEGCSMGGREAMMVTQRLPSYFNGVVVGDPGHSFSAAGVKNVYYAHQLGALATSMGLINGFGVPFVNNTYTLQDLQLVSKAILTACDALDGLVDGMVNNSQACTTALVEPQLHALECAGPKTAACLTPNQVTTIVNMYDKGAPNSQGVPQYAKWMWDPGIAGCTSAVDCNGPNSTNIGQGWRGWNIGSYNASFVPFVTNAANGATILNLGGGAVPVLHATPPYLPSATANDGLAKQMMLLDIDDISQRIFATTAQFPVSSWGLLNTSATDLSPFRNAGGKVVIHQPQTGGPFSPQYLVDWYTRMNQAMGGAPTSFAPTQKFARLFLVPGANHCGGGPSTSNYKALDAVTNWVENGVAPASIIGTAPAATPWPGRSRPLCPYPAYARYKGTGDINVASNFYCQ